MIQSDSHRVIEYFTIRSRDITPAPLRHTAHMLYAPVSNDPQITRLCASVLSPQELRRAERFIQQGDRSLFLQRRAFRRFCAARTLGSAKPLSCFAFDAIENGRPYLGELSQCWFSFSSCRFGFLGAWSSTHAVGIDIEDRTTDPGATELARQFYSSAEQRAVAGHGGLANLQPFYQLWCLKEAALKSIGEGLPFGLGAFEFELSPNLRVIHAPPVHGGPRQFGAYLIEEGDSCLAMVIRSHLV